MKKITAYPVGGSGAEFVIGDNTAARGARPWITSLGNGMLDGSIEEIPFIESQYPLFYDRGNQTTAIQPTVDIGFATEDLRDAYLLDVQRLVPLLCHVEIVAGETTLWIPNARMRPITWRVIGEVAVEITYTIRGQLLVSDTPIVP